MYSHGARPTGRVLPPPRRVVTCTEPRSEDFLLQDFLRYLERGKVITLKEMDPVLELR